MEADEDDALDGMRDPERGVLRLHTPLDQANDENHEWLPKSIPASPRAA